MAIHELSLKASPGSAPLNPALSVLAPETKPHWELIQHTEGGSAALLRHYEDYANTLAQNMRKTYLSPFTIVACCWPRLQTQSLHPHIKLAANRCSIMQQYIFDKH
uniref:AGRL2-4 GAIN subdomain A domain-containing protein n=1 Tax=Xiphophorus couchianus TaxID=32473 RepID=A0A3B5L9Y1_9TELE